jgi:NADPH:quinone reductase-like Zn-dependent oxidoreductase
MKAIFFEKHGEIENLKYADLPDIKPQPGEALVKVRAVALNHLDIWVRRGWKGLNLKMPHITGCDISGEVVSLNGVGEFKAGVKVIVSPGVNTIEDEWVRRGEDSVSPGYKIIGENLPGGLAEYVTVPIRNLFTMPENLSYEEAAAPILVGTTVWRMLLKRAALQPGETVLVVGSGGGVNSLTIALAKAFGATVFALAGGEKKCKLAAELGADEVIDYKKVSAWPTQVLKSTKGRGVDIVVDNVGESTFAKSLQATRRGGRIVTVGNTSGYNVAFDNRMLFAKQISLIGSTMGSRQDFIDAMEFIHSKQIKIPIDRIEKLSKGIEMIRYLEEGKQFGKIVLRPN